VHSRQNWNGLLGDVNTSKNGSSFRDSRKPFLKNFRRQMVQMQINVVLQWPWSNQIKMISSTGKTTVLALNNNTMLKDIPTPRPSLISIVIDLETTSREARSFAVGAYRSMKRSPSLFLRIPPSPREPDEKNKVVRKRKYFTNHQHKTTCL
jgi:hypothetical protein